MDPNIVISPYTVLLILIQLMQQGLIMRVMCMVVLIQLLILMRFGVVVEENQNGSNMLNRSKQNGSNGSNQPEPNAQLNAAIKQHVH